MVMTIMCIRRSIMVMQLTGGDDGGDKGKFVSAVLKNLVNPTETSPN
jgi:hypothetical protein